MDKRFLYPRNLKELVNMLPQGSVELVYPGEKLVEPDIYSKIYHTTSLNSFLLIWAKKRLKFAPITGVNDMLEQAIEITHESPQLLPMLFALQDIRKNYKQISFTMDFDSSVRGYASPLIWGIYGDKNRGVCIELDFNKLNLPDSCFGGVVEYEEILNKKVVMPQEVNTINSLKAFIKSNKDRLFFTKGKCWEHENEYRLISDSDEYLDISKAITAVYVTNIDDLSFEIVDELLKDTNIHFGCIRVNKNDGMLYEIDAREYKEHVMKARNNPENAMAKIMKQAQEHYDSLKNDPDANLTKIEYNI